MSVYEAEIQAPGRGGQLHVLARIHRDQLVYFLKGGSSSDLSRTSQLLSLVSHCSPNAWLASPSTVEPGKSRPTSC